jgi:hypothetical protein
MSLQSNEWNPQLSGAFSVALGHATLYIYSGNLLIEWPNGYSTITGPIDDVRAFYSQSKQERIGSQDHPGVLIPL